ncbi:uncharacterized protein [Rutidosis leptorrhynchoides]|uniref:uncharacterized protein n=1 Tax=Rutidosis leptorrhynchoides TaxID=125765 RepID=UPI003A998FB3
MKREKMEEMEIPPSSSQTSRAKKQKEVIPEIPDTDENKNEGKGIDKHDLAIPEIDLNYPPADVPNNLVSSSNTNSSNAAEAIMYNGTLLQELDDEDIMHNDLLLEDLNDEDMQMYNEVWEELGGNIMPIGEIYLSQFGDDLDSKMDIPPAEDNTVSRPDFTPSSIKEEDIRRKFKLFKQYDVADDYSDHHFSKQVPMKEPPKPWVKAVQEEWRILEKDLPDTIFVRVYESRMDLLRAAIIGARGTPYHDGLFFFDIYFPNDYPNVPPNVYYHSGGLQINPNLYVIGMVCLSLLNTWDGNGNEKWIPGKSTMLQVLVSIQALILNKDPYFNEPAFEMMRGSRRGESLSRAFNELVFIKSLKTMLYTMRRPPKHFEDFVVGHFFDRALGILVACEEYIGGARVGCAFEGGVEDVDATDKTDDGGKFRNSLKEMIKHLVKAFSTIGAKDCDGFLIPEIIHGRDFLSFSFNPNMKRGYFHDKEIPSSENANKQTELTHEIIDLDDYKGSNDVAKKINKKDKGKGIVLHSDGFGYNQPPKLIPEIIDLDDYKGSNDVGEKFNRKNIGKGTMLHSDGFGCYQPPKENVQGSFPNQLPHHADMKMRGLASSFPDNLFYKNSSSGNGNVYSDKWVEDSMDIDMDDHAMLQACLESMNVPAGVEANIPWYQDISQSRVETESFPKHLADHQTDIEMNHFNPFKSSVPDKSHTDMDMEQMAIMQAILESMNVPAGVEADVPCFPDIGGNRNRNSKKQLASVVGNSSLNHLSSHQSSESSRSFRSKKKVVDLGGSASDYRSKNVSDQILASHRAVKSNWGHEYIPMGSDNAYNSSQDEIMVSAEDNNTNQDSIKEDDIKRKFKQFDTVEDHSDHHYSSYAKASSTKQQPKKWAKAIQDEWRILEKDLPDTIFVRVYESRMDILRAAIIGAEGTPYHDGLFFFDVFFPNDYPNVPPNVYYHSGGLRINPNLYNKGKVCLSLLNTWSGGTNERWIPGKSTILQVLVSIQGLVLNKDPYFNEPGYAGMWNTAHGKSQSHEYTKNAFILSLRTMLYTMNRPPKHFEDLVVGHFCDRAHVILEACKAYIGGAPVGCVVKRGVQDVAAADSPFRNSLEGMVNQLVKAFSGIGAKDCDKFLIPGRKSSVKTFKDATLPLL